LTKTPNHTVVWPQRKTGQKKRQKRSSAVPQSSAEQRIPATGGVLKGGKPTQRCKYLGGGGGGGGAKPKKGEKRGDDVGTNMPKRSNGK